MHLLPEKCVFSNEEERDDAAEGEERRGGGDSTCPRKRKVGRSNFGVDFGTNYKPRSKMSTGDCQQGIMDINLAFELWTCTKSPRWEQE